MSRLGAQLSQSEYFLSYVKSMEGYVANNMEHMSISSIILTATINGLQLGMDFSTQLENQTKSNQSKSNLVN